MAQIWQEIGTCKDREDMITFFHGLDTTYNQRLVRRIGEGWVWAGKTLWSPAEKKKTEGDSMHLQASSMNPNRCSRTKSKRSLRMCYCGTSLEEGKQPWEKGKKFSPLGHWGKLRSAWGMKGVGGIPTSGQGAGLCTGLRTEKMEGKRTEKTPSLRHRIQCLPKTET